MNKAYLETKFPRYALGAQEGEIIALIKWLYESYSNMGLSWTPDRPIAISALEQRLTSALNTRSIGGVFEKYWGLCLLWKKAGWSFTMIEFPECYPQPLAGPTRGTMSPFDTLMFKLMRWNEVTK
jgi:hypothetical protein